MLSKLYSEPYSQTVTVLKKLRVTKSCKGPLWYLYISWLYIFLRSINGKMTAKGYFFFCLLDKRLIKYLPFLKIYCFFISFFMGCKSCNEPPKTSTPSSWCPLQYDDWSNQTKAASLVTIPQDKRASKAIPLAIWRLKTSSKGWYL